HKNLTNGTTYYYVVTASNDAGESSASSEVSAIRFTTNPSALTVAPANANITISWPAVVGAASYTLYHRTSTGVTIANGTKIENITGTSYAHTGLTNNTTYYYILTATDAAGEATASSEVSGMPRKFQKQFLYVADSAAANLRIRPFTVSMDTGLVTAGTDATAPSGIFRLVADPQGRFLYALNGTLIRPYTVNQTTGALTAGTDLTAGNIDMELLPNGLFAYLISGQKITRYAVNQTTGALESGTDVITGLGNLLNRITIDSNGSYLYVTDSSNNRLLPYSINSSGGISAGPPTTITGGVVDLALAPNGNFIFEMSSGGGANNLIAPFAISSGTLTAGATVGQGGSDAGQLLSVDGSGLFLYELSGTGLSVYVHSINQTTGALGSAGSVATSITRMTSEPTGRFFYTVASTTLTAYTINSSSGVLTSIGTATAANSSPSIVHAVILGIP
ncbi:MAG: hypothetical protein Q7S98_07045, partial [Deltaproteobacteria bacterium]|nr:hypothetical protein [Deltaproteobacteria bacterium]